MPYKYCKMCKKRISMKIDYEFCSNQCELDFNNIPDKFCKNCNKKLKDKISNKKFCNLLCANEYQKKINMVERTCINCGKKYTVKKSSKKIKLCSNECVIDYSKSEDRNDKRMNTLRKNNKDKYGVEYYFQTDEFREKFEKTCMEKYNVNNPMKCKIIKSKAENTNLEKYLDINPMKNVDIKNKVINTNLDKYGVKYPLQNKDIFNKMKKSNRDDNGNEFYNNREKCKKTKLERYGDEFYSNKEKASKTKLKKSYYNIRKKYKNYIIPLFNENEYIGSGYDNLYEFKCVKCGNKFKHWIYSGIIPRCNNCYPKLINTSKGEKEILDFVKNIFDNNVQSNVRNILDSKKELDIFIENKNLAIEFNGIKWHSEIFGEKNKKYHVNKTEECSIKNIELIHIFENEWIYKQDIIKSIIKSKLNIYDKTIYARKCVVKEISEKEKNSFLEKNHLHGKDISSVKLGLFYENELMSIMTFGKSRFNKNIEYEMLRFTNKLNTKIIGGASKLFSYFIKQYDPKSIISYSDRRYFGGNIYEKLGFKFIENTIPNYFYFDNREYLNLYNRIKFQKHKLPKILNKYNNNLTEWENMQINGYDRIFDCGNKKFIWNK